MVIIFTIYGGILIISGEHLFIASNGTTYGNQQYLKLIYLSLLPIYAYYSFAKQRQLTKASLSRWVIVFYIVAILIYVHTQRMNLLALADAGLARTEQVNNTAYLFLSIIPCLLLWNKRPFLQVVLLLISVMFIVASMKRGAIIIAAISVLFFLFFNFRNYKRGTKWFVLLLSSVAIVVAVIFVKETIESNDFFVARINRTLEGDSSGRGELLSFFWNKMVRESSIFNMLFGYGACGTIKIGSNFAHNDWMEIFVNQGIFGVILYAYYWVGFFKTWHKVKCCRLLWMIIGELIIIHFSKTLFSMSYSDMMFFSAIVLGYSLVQVESPHYGELAQG